MMRLLLLVLLGCFLPLVAEQYVCDSSEAGDNCSEGMDEEATNNRETRPEMINHTLDEFMVAGVDLASYIPGETQVGSRETTEEPFELYKDFDIAHLVRGDETWDDIIGYRNTLQRPSLSFYVDKVARKRWLPQQGFQQPEAYAVKYMDELPLEVDYAQTIRALLPTNKSYCAKPTHMSEGMGNWQVQYDEHGKPHYTPTGTNFTEGDLDLVQQEVATGLAYFSHNPAAPHESWALKNVKPGFVVEELYKAHDNPLTPPHEVKLFTIWGRLWVGQWNKNHSCMGFIYRNGTTTQDSFYGYEHGYDKLVPDWMQWTKLVELAETLGAHKDMFRTDVFVGIPHGGREMKIAVSESEIFPTTIFGRHKDDVGLQNEGARLWVAGYKIGNYKVVDNTEIPTDYVQSNS